MALLCSASANTCRANSTRVDCATTECACLTDCPGWLLACACVQGGLRRQAWHEESHHIMPSEFLACIVAEPPANFPPFTLADVQGILNTINGKPCSIDCDAQGNCKFDIQVCQAQTPPSVCLSLSQSCQA